MLFEDLATAWRARLRDAPIEPEPTFENDRLIIGAGTMLAQRTDLEGRRALESETRLLTLLTVAYGRGLSCDQVNHIRRATARWREGDLPLARVHMALAKLGHLPDRRNAARRVFMAEQLLKAGATPETLLGAIEVGATPHELLRRYNADQPRVAAGNGVESGRWTSGDGSGDGESESAEEPAAGAHATPQAAPALSAEDAAVDALSLKPPPSAEQGAQETAEKAIERAILRAKQSGGSAIEGLTTNELADIAGAARLPLAATVFAGVLLTPTNAMSYQRQNVPGRPGYFYERYPGELGWHVFFTSEDGHPTEIPIGPDGIFRDSHGQAIARYLPDGGLVLDLKPHLEAGVRGKPAELCPSPTPDKFGQGADSRSKAYENQMKLRLNPEQPTPPDMGRALPLPTRPTGIVIFDDCWLKTGDMFDYKGPGYAGLIAASSKSGAEFKFELDWISTSADQVESAGTRRVVWCFSEPETARFAYNLFQRTDNGRERIIVAVFPYHGG